MQNNAKGGLGLADYLALYHLSMRSFFWKIDGRQGLKQLGKSSNDALGMAVYFLALIIAYMPFILALAVVTSISKGIFNFLGTLVMSAFYILIFTPVIFNLEKLRYNLNFTKSVWWQGTGIRPSEIRKDRGLYGEYIATIAAEGALRHSKVYGRVFNSVIVPKTDGDFNEIDILSVNECGLHVIEAKARGGAFYGNLVGETWKQEIGGQSYEMQNPIVQNQNHINFLQEYLYGMLPEGETRLKATFPLTAQNIVLFAQVDIEDHLNHAVGPKECFFGMAEGHNGYQHLDLETAFSRRLTPAEVDEIAAVIEGISGYTQAELSSFKQEREARRERGVFRHRVSYSVAQVQSLTLTGEYEVNDFVCRRSGDYCTFLDTDNLFKALPGAEILSQGAETPSLDAALAELNRI